jgi:hypothetical protein
MVVSPATPPELTRSSSFNPITAPVKVPVADEMGVPFDSTTTLGIVTDIHSKQRHLVTGRPAAVRLGRSTPHRRRRMNSCHPFEFIYQESNMTGNPKIANRIKVIKRHRLSLMNAAYK